MNKDIYREIIDTEKISGFFWIYKFIEFINEPRNEIHWNLKFVQKREKYRTQK